ncbi:MAG: UDP-N-acetylmuramoyl-L-alanine--D-glutamate ligase [Chlamydiae bacterium]|nr:UDP-N-acetylmuramoyl-L-alanine--D-glutamate ligase [Chlamydiota bacterium]
MKKKALILGMGLSGQASAKWLLSIGYHALGVDSKRDTLSSLATIQELAKAGCFVLSDADPIDVASFDEIIISPGIAPSHPILQAARSYNIPIIGEAELALRSLGGRRAVAVTGTNGKTTVARLVEHVLTVCGYKARALGNIGLPFSTYLRQIEPDEIVVAELSSFQLETMHARVFEAAALLNISPDHLDRYPNMVEYAAAKCRLQGCLKPGAPFYVFTEAAREFGYLLEEHCILFGDDLSASLWTDGHVVKEEEEVKFFFLKESPCFAKHDYMNALAAWGLCKALGIDSNQFTHALCTFKKPLHRMEFIRNVGGVDFYDDSKGTNIDAVVQAVMAMKGPVILIAGGVDKGSSYLAWKRPFTERVRELIVFGEAAEKMSRELGLFFKVTRVSFLAEAVHLAASSAVAGDVVLLSPGCSSFDMFRDYAHRGEEFQKCVNQLEERNKKV